MTITLKQGDCLELMKELESESVDLVILDPPYYKIMITEWNGNKHEWDNQWASFDDYLAWFSKVLVELKRTLKQNASLYVFADDKRSAYIRIAVEKFGWSLINEIIWVKKNNMPIKGWANFRSFAPITERILFFGTPESEYELTCDGLISNVFTPLREYLTAEKNKVGITGDEINALVGTASMAGRHYFANSQWCFPTEEHYIRMQLTFNVVFKKLKTIQEASNLSNIELSEVLRTNYEVLRTNYEDLRTNYEDLRRVFNPEKNFTDVWQTNLTSSTDNQIHPTQKPELLIRRIISTCSNKNAIVLDPFMGAGTTGVACQQLGRNFIGYEISSEYFKIASKRIAEAQAQEKLVLS